MNSRTPLAKYSGELLHAVIDNLAEGVLIYDSEGKVITANPAAEAILGRSLRELVGTRPTDRGCVASPVDPLAWPVDRHPPLDTLATGQPHRDVVKGVLRPDGKRVWSQGIAGRPRYGRTAGVSSFMPRARHIR
jgi:PAS domain S-box-containing protein